MTWESIRWPWASTTSWNDMNLNSNRRHPGISRALRLAGAGPLLRPRQENRQPDLVFVTRPVPLGVVHDRDIHLTRSQLRIRNRRRRVAAAANGHHEAVLAAFDASHGHAGERGGHHLVHKVGISAAQIVGQVADDRFLARASL